MPINNSMPVGPNDTVPPLLYARATKFVVPLGQALLPETW